MTGRRPCLMTAAAALIFASQRCPILRDGRGSISGNPNSCWRPRCDKSRGFGGGAPDAPPPIGSETGTGARFRCASMNGAYQSVRFEAPQSKLRPVFLIF